VRCNDRGTQAGCRGGDEERIGQQHTRIRAQRSKKTPRSDVDTAATTAGTGRIDTASATKTNVSQTAATLPFEDSGHLFEEAVDRAFVLILDALPEHTPFEIRERGDHPVRDHRLLAVDA